MQLPIHKVAENLDLPLTTVERWIRQGKIPVRRSGDVCIFQRVALEKWAEKHSLSFSYSGENGQEAAEPARESLLKIMQRGGVFHGVPGDTVPSVLQSVCERLPLTSDAARDGLLKRLIERENLTSTGIGKGVAIPHPRTPMEAATTAPLIATCFLDAPVDFNAVDDRPVFVVFALVSPNTKVHLHILSRLSFCLRDNGFIAFLKSAPAPDALFLKVGEIEKRLDRPEPV